MTNPTRRTPHLLVPIPAREPDEAFLARLTWLARASERAAVLPDPGTARWKVALAAASVAAIASGGAALSDVFNGNQAPSPVAPPTQLPTEDERDRKERDPTVDRAKPEEGPLGSGPDAGFGGSADPSQDVGPTEPPDNDASQAGDDQGAGEGDDPDGADDHDRDDDSGDSSGPSGGDDDRDEDSGDNSGSGGDDDSGSSGSDDEPDEPDEDSGEEPDEESGGDSGGSRDD